MEPHWQNYFKKMIKNQFTNLVLLLAVKQLREHCIGPFIYNTILYLNATNKSVIIHDNGPMHPIFNVQLCGVMIVFAGGYFVKNNLTYGFLLYMHTRHCRHIRLVLSEYVELDHEIVNYMLSTSKLPIQDIFVGNPLLFSEDDILFIDGGCVSYRTQFSNEYALNSGNYKPIYDNSVLNGYPFIENITYPIIPEPDEPFESD